MQGWDKVSHALWPDNVFDDRRFTGVRDIMRTGVTTEYGEVGELESWSGRQTLGA